MVDILQAVVLIGSLLLLLGLGVWIGFALIACAIIGLVFFADTPAGLIFAAKSWESSTSSALTALPLFIWMGEISYRSRLAQDLFAGLGPWVRCLPGGSVLLNYGTCGMVDAVSCSSS